MSEEYGQTNSHKTKEVLIPTSKWGEDVLIDLGLLKDNLLDVQRKIAHCNTRIIAVTKYYGLDSIIKGYEAGLRDFGESRAIESIEKINALPKEIKENSTFHFIGHLQTNKASKVVEYFDCIHSVDSLKLAKAISNSACHINKRERILLQVNNSGETQKSGFTKEDLRANLAEILKLSNIEVVGLMNIAPLNASEYKLRGLFRDIREFRDKLEQEFEIKLPELSMGMSNDYEIAVSEGATVIRLGRMLFK